MVTAPSRARTTGSSLPALREELSVHEGPRLHEGQPSWTLHDPARNRFYRLDWLTFEILHRWSIGDPSIIARLIAEETPLAPTEQDVLAVVQFATANQLLKFAAGAPAEHLAGLYFRARPSWLSWLIHNYLFFRVPLLKPDRLLQGLARRCGFLFRPLFWQLTGLALVVGLVLLVRQWDVFTATLSDFRNLPGLVGFFVVLVGVKVVHEFGHGIVAAHFGCRVPTMGIAFLVMTPVAYTDTNEAWSLTARKPRLLIGAAGILAELCLAAWATLAWTLLPDGHLRSSMFVVATITWVKSLVVNTSPVMRFDGYYLLSDALDLPNLHTRCFALARWRLREALFRLGEPPPEYFRRPLRRGLIALAVAIWLYRLIVFVGIAIFVYHYFFKALGLVLFAIEISWFVAIPIFSEMKVWFKQRRAIFRSPRFPAVAAVAAALLLLACLPLPRRIRLAGELHPSQEFEIVAPESAQLATLPWRNGDRVRAGQELLRLESPAVRYNLEKTRLREASLAATLASAASDPEKRAGLPVMQAGLGAVQAQRTAAEVALAQLQPQAPFDGRFAAASEEVRPGEWVARRQHLGSLIGDQPWIVVAYLDERDAHLVSEGATAQFFPEGVWDRPVALTLTSIERDTSRTLTHPMLASLFGGSVPARATERELVPDHAVYLVRFTTQAVPAELLNSIRRGHVTINAGAESLFARFGRHALSIAWREMGF